MSKHATVKFRIVTAGGPLMAQLPTDSEVLTSAVPDAHPLAVLTHWLRLPGSTVLLVQDSRGNPMPVVVPQIIALVADWG